MSVFEAYFLRGSRAGHRLVSQQKSHADAIDWAVAHLTEEGETIQLWTGVKFIETLTYGPSGHSRHSVDAAVQDRLIAR